jgi:hypothetical protein
LELAVRQHVLAHPRLDVIPERESVPVVGPCLAGPVEAKRYAGRLEKRDLVAIGLAMDSSASAPMAKAWLGKEFVVASEK